MSAVCRRRLLRAAKVVGEIDRGRHLGIAVDGLSADFDAVMGQVRKARSRDRPRTIQRSVTRSWVSMFISAMRILPVKTCCKSTDKRSSSKEH